MTAITNKLTVKKLQQIILLVICTISMFLAVMPPVMNTFAAKSDKDVIQDGLKDYTGGKEENEKSTAHLVGNKLAGSAAQKRENTFGYVFSRIIIPGYINDVRSAVPPKDGWDKAIYEEKGQTYICNKKSPKNLLGYNCDIPNLSAQILQAFVRVFSSTGVQNGARESGTPIFGLGVPNNIPGGAVPVDEEARSSQYTGLELFGYNMHWTTYNGEWDDIIPSSSARMLANYGTLDKLNVAGNMAISGAKTGAGTFFDKVTWNPGSWLPAISKAWEAGTSASFLVIFDTSDANIAATHGWTRSGLSVAQSFYRVYVLSDRQVINMSTTASANYVMNAIVKQNANNKDVKEIQSLATAPTFKADPNKLKDEFKKKQDDAKKKLAEWEKADKDTRGDKPEVPKPTKEDYMSENDQYLEWVKSDKTVQAAANGQFHFKAGEAKTYSDFKKKWASEYNDGKNTVTDRIGEDSKKIATTFGAIFFKLNPHYNATNAISHYVCAHKDGSPYMNADGTYVYLFDSENDAETEHVNQKCAANLPIRPTIQGGYFGNGYSDGVSDTRHVSKNGTSLISMIPIIGNLGENIQGLCNTAISFITMIINELMNLSFAPLMDQLGITTIVKAVFTNLRDTTFYPLMGLVVAIGGVSMFIDVIRSRSLVKFMLSLLTMAIVLLVGVAIVNKPDKFIDTMDKIPLTVENAITNTLLKDSDKSNICSTTSGDNTGVRSAQCYIWKDVMFNTWTYGQFGTGFDNLYPNNQTGQSQDGNYFKNNNEELVGNPVVNFGGGKKVSNWALYQYSLMTSGTITTPDPNNPQGIVDRNIYRLVDLQAGPDDAKDSDPTYWNNWTGRVGNRTGIAIMGLILAILALIAIGKMLITKIELTFIMSIMTLGLPVMLLFGLTPSGAKKLKGYIVQLFSMMLKRIIMVTLLCALLLILDSVSASGSNDFTTTFVASGTILLFFIVYRPQILKLFTLSDESLFSGAGLLSGDPDEVKRVLGNYVPRFVKNIAYQANNFVRGIATGAVGGFIGTVAANRTAMRRNLNDKEFLASNHLQRNNRFATMMAKRKYKMKQGIHAFDGVGTNVTNQIKDARIFQSNRANNFLTRQGLTNFEQLSRVKRQLEKDSFDQMMNREDDTMELFQTLSNRSSIGHKYKSADVLQSDDEKQLKNHPEQIAKLRRMSKRANNKVTDAGILAEGLDVAARNKGDEDKDLEQFDKYISRRAYWNKMLHPIAYEDDTAEQRAAHLDAKGNPAESRFVHLDEREAEHAKDNIVHKDVAALVVEESIKQQADPSTTTETTDTDTTKAEAIESMTSLEDEVDKEDDDDDTTKNE